MKGYKVFNHDFTCRGFQFEVGKTYKHDGDIGLCKAGFHFCRKASDCFSFYEFNPDNKVAEVEAIGLVESDEIKSVTNEIEIIREIPWAEVLTIVNEGKGCTGLCNTGYRNTGNRNTGDRNTGNRNTGNRNTGYFSTITPKIDLFEKPSGLTIEEVRNIKGIRVLNWNYENNWWIYSHNMTAEEKAAHPEYETLGGYLKSIPFKDACQLMWDRLTTDEKSAVREIPNFDADIFERITGIRVES